MGYMYRWQRVLRMGASAAALLAVIIASRAVAFDLGPGEIEATVDRETMEVYTFRPSGCAAPSLLFIFHGNSRSARSYRNSAEDFADQACFVVYAPLFDKVRFPNWSYHRGGIVEEGVLRPEDEWTVELVDDLIAWARDQEGRPDAPVFLFGHSAGAQFLSRVAAYALPKEATRIVLANPSTYVVPSVEEDAPYGFGLLPTDEASQDLREYLAAPITIYLGLEDTGDEDLTMTEEAQRQGDNRLDRGRHVYEQGRNIAEENGWNFNWRLVYADGVGHTAGGMLRAEEFPAALGF